MRENPFRCSKACSMVIIDDDKAGDWLSIGFQFFTRLAGAHCTLPLNNAKTHEDVFQIRQHNIVQTMSEDVISTKITLYETLYSLLLLLLTVLAAVLHEFLRW